jgi:pyruvate dehydrogenase E2 component (dihydrolipoamide acetyltransferase)
MENARLVRWLKRVGDLVKQGEPLLELETEKSVVEIEATESGRLLEILLQADQEVHVGDQVGWLESESERPVATGSGVVSNGESNASATTESYAQKPSRAQPSPITGRIKSSPVARRLAAEHSLDLRRVAATGPRGRIQLSDVRRAIEARQGQGPNRGQEAPIPAAPTAVGRQPLSSMRRAVARSMTLSNATVPQFIVERAVDWSAIERVRSEVLAGLPANAPRPSVNDFLLQAIARSLLAFPQLNATFSGDADSPEAALLPASGTHIGMVVAVESGLLVPVLHEVERVGVVELARRRSETVQRAQSGRLRRDELEGATFSLSNLGARGPDRFTALINPPQSAILAVGRQRDCVVAIQGGIHVRPMSQLTLTVDHRVADGRLAADFLAYLVGVLEGNDWRVN